MGNISERGSVEEAESYKGKLPQFSGVGMCCSNNLAQTVANLHNEEPKRRRPRSTDVHDLRRIEAIDFDKIEEFALETRFLCRQAQRDLEKR